MASTLRRLVRCLPRHARPLGVTCTPRRPHPAGTRGVAGEAMSRGVAELADPYVFSSPYEDLKLPDISYGHYIMDVLGQHGDRLALIEGETERQLTYAQLKDSVVRVASALSRMGIKKGDVISLHSPNCIDFIIFYIATATTGAIVSTTNPLYTPGELIHAVIESQSCLIATIPALLPVVNATRAQCPNIKDVVVFGKADGCRSMSEMLDDDGGMFPQDPGVVPEKDLLVLPFSSGTTGLPKGVMLTHANMIANCLQTTSRPLMQLGADERALGVLPLFHIYGQMIGLLNAVTLGHSMVTLGKFDPQLYLSWLQRHKVTVLHMAPPIVLFLSKHPLAAKVDFSSVHTAFNGAAPLGANQIEEFLSKTNNNIAFRNGYGLTEASPVTNFNPPEKHLIKYSTVGPMVHNTQGKIVNIETGESLAPGDEGEFCVRGPQVMKGYLCNPTATADTIVDGWLHTGDIGFVDTDGHVTISDRLKELIKTKGYQVAPAELEALLTSHPAVTDAAVIGVPDDRAGEVPRAYVVLKPDCSATQEDIQNYVKGKVAEYKELAGGVEFRSEIPKSPAGKILRKILKEELRQELGLN